MNIDKNFEEIELDRIFNRHNETETILNKLQVKFNSKFRFKLDDVIVENKKILRNFRNQNILKNESFFAGDIAELFPAPIF